MAIHTLIERTKLGLTRKSITDFTDADYPDVPKGLGPTGGKVPLLAIYLPDKDGKTGLERTFETYYDLTGIGHSLEFELKSDPDHLRAIPDYDYKPGIRWVWLDPGAYHGLSPMDALLAAKCDKVYLAGLEVLMAVYHFPKWAAHWNGTTVPYPWLAGLQFWSEDVGNAWSDVPYLRSDACYGSRPQLALDMDWRDQVHRRLCSPAITEY